MKKSKLFLFSILVLFGCQETNLEPEIAKNTIERVSTKNELDLYDKLNHLFEVGNARMASNGDYLLDSAIKVVNNVENSVYYSFRSVQSDYLSFSNLVYEEIDGKPDAYCLTYLPTIPFDPGFTDNLKNFTGKVLGTNLNGDTISMAEVSNGRVQVKASTGGRVNTVLPDFPKGAGCYELWQSETTSLYSWIRISCGQSGSGGTSGGGNGPSGDGGSGTSGGYGNGPSGDGGGSSGGGAPHGTGGGGGGNGEATDGNFDPPTEGSVGGSSGPGINPPILCELGFVEFKGECVSDVEYNVIMLESVLSVNQFALIDIDCDQIKNWKALAQHIPKQSIIDKLNTLDKTKFGDFNVQNIANASGAVVNMDYFPITIKTLPINPSTGKRFTASGLLNHIRKNINNFVNTNYSDFSPSTITGTNESALWLSNNPLGAILHIDIPNGPGDGSVICSQYSSTKWTFTTIEVAYWPTQGYDGEHPVSGNRELGITTNADGTYTFYTRGVDRITAMIDAVYAENFLDDSFADPDALWNSLKNKVHNYVKNNGGASVAPKVSDNSINRVNWDEVKAVLKGDRSISDLGCN